MISLLFQLPTWVLTVLFLGCLVAFYNWMKSTSDNTKKPPSAVGQWIWFLVQNIVFKKDKKIHAWFQEMGKKIGPMFRLRLGHLPVVYIDDYQTVRKAFAEMGDTFSGRPTEIGRIASPDEVKAVLIAEGNFWREHRRFALTTLRDFGIGKSSLEPAILNEIQHFLDALDKKSDTAFDMNQILTMSIANNIAILSFGKRFEYDNQRFHDMKVKLEANVNAQAPLLPIAFPILRYIPGYERLFRVNTYKENYAFYMSIFNELLQEHLANYQTGSKADYIDAYITERNERKRQQDPTAELFDDETIRQNLSVLFIAGSETTTTSILFIILFMITHPDVQRKVQKEIDDVIGSNRMPSYEDKKLMPYTEATIMEALRKGTPASLNVPHSAMEDTKLNGYDIKRRTLIQTNLWSIHHDEKLFPDPHSFRPERFINEEGKVIKSEHLIPFSIGKRFCIGEPLARLELFLYITSMLQKFTFSIPEGEVVTTERNDNVVGGVYPYKVKITVRK